MHTAVSLASRLVGELEHCFGIMEEQMENERREHAAALQRERASSEQAADEARAAASQRDELEERLLEASEEGASLLARLREAQSQRDEMEGRLVEARDEIACLLARLREADAQLADLRAYSSSLQSVSSLLSLERQLAKARAENDVLTRSLRLQRAEAAASTSRAAPTPPAGAGEGHANPGAALRTRDGAREPAVGPAEEGQGPAAPQSDVALREVRGALRAASGAVDPCAAAVLSDAAVAELRSRPGACSLVPRTLRGRQHWIDAKGHERGVYTLVNGALARVGRVERADGRLVLRWAAAEAPST